MLKKILLVINKYASKLNVWSWQKLWGNRETGVGYQHKKGANYVQIFKKTMAKIYRLVIQRFL